MFRSRKNLVALGTLEVEKILHEVAKDVCKRTMRNGRSIRAINPWSKQLKFLAKGEWALNGFRNAHLCQWLEPGCRGLSLHERRKLSAKAIRFIGLLRALALVQKVSKEHRYVLTAKGQAFANALLAASSVAIKQLTELAA